MQLKKQEVTSTRPAEVPVACMFHERSVFITGATGFIGRVLVEKLLRSYLTIRSIYILMRPKKNQPPKERLHKHLLSAPIFDAIRAMPNGGKLFDKIVVIPGDIGEPNLGISNQDLQTMLTDESLSIVFHSAATLKFDEPLKVSIELNLIATRSVIEICRKLPNLISLCHVSTAYVNSDIKDSRLIEERLYPIRNKPDDLIKLSQILDADLMQKLKGALVGERPNTYTYTKALTEKMIVEEASDLPVVIVRPSVVIAAWKQPLPGWIDNLNGPTGLMLAIGKGLCRSLHMNANAIADMIPVDIVVNTMIASAFYAARASNKLDSAISSSNCCSIEQSDKDKLKNEFHLIKGGNDKSMDEDCGDQDELQHVASAIEKSPPIVHCNSGQLNPITWGGVEEFFFKVIRNYPSCHVFRYPNGTIKSSYLFDLVTRIFVHYLPALIFDSFRFVVGKRAKLLPLYDKMHIAIATLRHFCTQNYNFQTSNMKIIHDSLTNTDKRDLYIDIENMNWGEFWNDYTLGVRRFILKEDDKTLPQAHKSLSRVYYYELCLRVILIALGIFYYLPSINRFIRIDMARKLIDIWSY